MRDGFTMDDFRREMIARGVYKNGRRVLTAREQRLPRGRQGGRRKPWPVFVAELLASCRTRLAELEQRSPADVMPCPWGAVFGGECVLPCRCEGRREVTVGFMVAHYRLVIVTYRGER